MEPIIKVYIAKGSLYVINGKYNALIQTDKQYLDNSKEYYEYILRLPEQEVARIIESQEVEPNEM